MGEKELPSASFPDELAEIIAKDDVKSFKNYMEKYPCGSFRLGRFPVLSALYLCRSGKILRAYEKQFSNVNGWQPLTEPLTLSANFRKVAGKCLRLYLDETVTPVEMLALTGQTRKLKKNFDKFRLSSAAKQRVKEIYRIKYGLEVVYEGNKAYFPKRPLNRREKNAIIISCVGAFILAASAVSVPFIVNQFHPFIKDKNGALRVSAVSQIDFGSDNKYVLKNDLTLSKDFYRENFKCTIDGNGKTINFNGDKSAFKLLSGTIKNAVIKTTASVPFIYNVDIPATIENVTVKAQSDIEISDSFGYLAYNNYGAIKGVTLYAEGSVNVIGSASDGVFAGGIVANNKSYAYFMNTYYGSITNCNAVYTDFNLTGVSGADASFGGLVGQNSGIISSSSTDGNLSSDTVDAAGICGTNKYYVINCENKSSITQISHSAEWNPVCAGITVSNEGAVRYCKNFGNISSSSEIDSAESENIPQAVAAGIAGSATSYIYGSANYGAICAEATGNAFAGGICGQSYCELYYCLSEGGVSVKGAEAYGGGIAAITNATVIGGASIRFGFAEYCVSDCKISAKSEKAYIGGITGFIGAGQINYTDLNGEITQTVYFGGAIYCLSLSDYSITGSGYSGGIAGVCSKIMTDGADGGGNVNTFVWNNLTYESFKDNVYVKSDGSKFAAGACATAEGDDVTYGDGSDAGASSDLKDNIKASELYAQILENLTEKDE